MPTLFSYKYGIVSSSLSDMTIQVINTDKRGDGGLLTPVCPSSSSVHGINKLMYKNVQYPKWVY